METGRSSAFLDSTCSEEGNNEIGMGEMKMMEMRRDKQLMNALEVVWRMS